MQTRTPLFYLLCCFSLFATSSHAEQSPLAGLYWLPDKDGQVEIFERDGKFIGKVTAYDVADQLDELNPNPELQGQPFVGSLMFEGFSFKAKSKRWEGGTIYDASEGKVYKCRLWFEGDDHTVLKARGYIGMPMLGRTEEFHRVE